VTSATAASPAGTRWELRGVDGELVELAAPLARADRVEPIAEVPAPDLEQQRVALADRELRERAPVVAGKGAQQRERARRSDAGSGRRPTRRAARRSKGCAASAVTKVGGVSTGSVGSVTLRSRSQPSFSSLMCSIAMPFAFASYSAARTPNTQQRYTLLRERELAGFVVDLEDDVFAKVLERELRTQARGRSSRL